MKAKRNHWEPAKGRRAAAPRLWHPEVPGPLRNGSRRVSMGQIKAYCRVLAREFRPQRIILFGSYASGSATPASDVDLMVVLPFRGSATDKMVEIRSQVEAPFPMDLLVWRPTDERRTDSFAHSILAEGKLMYESRDA